MVLDKSSGLLQEATYHRSPNQDDRPNQEISGVVIHSISLPPNQFGGPWIDDLFLNRLNPSVHPYFSEIATIKVSSHILIRRNGQLLQYVPFCKRAWHAGVSEWDGRECCNDFTIGIELEGTDYHPFESIQYRCLAELISTLCKSYPDINPQRIKGHADIAPNRKTDPGPFFDWQILKDLLDSKEKENS